MMTLNRYAFLGIVLSLLPTSTAVLAANFNLQPYTTCDGYNNSFGFCYTALDVSVLGLSAQRISNLKTVNITQFLSKVGSGFNGISYAWSGNYLNVSGFVDKETNNYWSFGAGGDTYDPWWNVTSNVTWVNTTTFMGPAGGSGYYFCMNYLPNTTGVQMIEAFKFASDTATKMRIVRMSDNSEVFVGDFVGSRIMPNYTFTSGIGYHLCTSDYSGNRYHNDTPSYPYTFLLGSFVGGSYKQLPSTWGNVSETFAWLNFTFTYVTSSIYYEFNLSLNGADNANKSMYTNAMPVNITAYANFTPLNISLFQNGTRINTTIGNSTNITTLGAGVYNITATSNNSDARTYWLNVSTLNVPFDTNICFKTRPICIDTINNKVYINGKQQ